MPAATAARTLRLLREIFFTDRLKTNIQQETGIVNQFQYEIPEGRGTQDREWALKT